METSPFQKIIPYQSKMSCAKLEARTNIKLSVKLRWQKGKISDALPTLMGQGFKDTSSFTLFLKSIL